MQNNENSSSRKEQITDSQLSRALVARYPNQGFEQGISAQQEIIVLTWGSVLDQAKAGNFDRIRPDILVQYYDRIREIRQDQCNALETSTSKSIIIIPTTPSPSKQEEVSESIQDDTFIMEMVEKVLDEAEMQKLQEETE